MKKLFNDDMRYIFGDRSVEQMNAFVEGLEKFLKKEQEQKNRAAEEKTERPSARYGRQGRHAPMF